MSIPKGQRPAPSTYLSSGYIQQHLAKFEKEGGAFIVVKSWIEKGSYKEFPIRKFVMLMMIWKLLLENTGNQKISQ